MKTHGAVLIRWVGSADGVDALKEVVGSASRSWRGTWSAKSKGRAQSAVASTRIRLQGQCEFTPEATGFRELPGTTRGRGGSWALRA